MITAKQIRAARAYLGLDQKDIAQAVGVSVANISDIESEKSAPRASTLNTIELFFQTRGLKLTEAGGIEPAHNYMTVYEGGNCYLDFLNDAQEILSNRKGEILFSGSDERRSPDKIIEKFREMRAKGIKMRSLIERDNTYIMGSLDEYRWMPGDLFVDSDVKVIYADRVAHFLSWAEEPMIIVIKSEKVAEEAKRHFEFAWKQSEQPTQSTAPVCYEKNDV